MDVRRRSAQINDGSYLGRGGIDELKEHLLLITGLFVRDMHLLLANRRARTCCWPEQHRPKFVFTWRGIMIP
jgi:hypothetical protein